LDGDIWRAWTYVRASSKRREKDEGGGLIAISMGTWSAKARMWAHEGEIVQRGTAGKQIGKRTTISKDARVGLREKRKSRGVGLF